MTTARVVDITQVAVPRLTVRRDRPPGSQRPLRLVHVGIHSNLNGNAGDTLLFQTVRDVIESVAGDVEWERRQVWEALDVNEVDGLNRRSDGIVVGGGGLLLRDQRGSDTSRSGWQWSASTDAIRALSIPLAVVAVGYNRFRDQPDFDPPFTEHLEAVATASTLVGLRNTGSIRAVRAYLPAHLHDRLRLLRCPTTVLTQLYGLRRKTTSGAPVLGVNFALDRPGQRFGDQADVRLARFASAVAQIHQRGWRIRVLRHKQIDADAERYLDDACVTYDTNDVSSASPEQVVAAYAGLDVVAGMRGHGQMIPFGLQIPIVSVVTHDKLAWFLDDLGHPDWGVELGAPDATDRLVGAIEDAATDRRRNEIERLQTLVWAHSRETVRELTSAIRSSAMHPTTI